MQRLSALLSRQRWRASSRGPDAWRSVPKINLLSSSKPRINFTMFSVGLVALLVVEAIVLLFLYLGFEGAKDDRDEAQLAFDAVLKLDSIISSEIQELHAQIERVTQIQTEAERVNADIVSSRVDWSTSLSVLLGTEVPGTRFDTVIAVTESGEANLFGKASDVGAMVRFQSEIAGVAEILDLQSLRWQEIEQGTEEETEEETEQDHQIDFSAVFKLSRAPND